MKTTTLALALAALVSFAAAAQAAPAPAAPAAPAAATEKCYGVAKAGADVAIELPAGTCDKLVNGSLTAPAPKAEEKAPEKK